MTFAQRRSQWEKTSWWGKAIRDRTTHIRDHDSTYAAFTKSLAIIQFTHDPFKLLLQTQSPLALLLRCGGQSKDPFLGDSPDIGSRLPGLHHGQATFLLGLLLMVF